MNGCDEDEDFHEAAKTSGIAKVMRAPAAQMRRK